MMKTISAAELSRLIASGTFIDLIDVRTPVEFRALHVTVARNVPLDRLDATTILEAQKANASEPIYVVCRSGGRSRQACEKLSTAGVFNLIDVEGGTLACVSAGAPITRGKHAIPLNCQVQIITGLAVVVGSVIAWATSNPYWLSLPLVMGAGLMFSGFTNTCAMGTILSRMPWNQVKPDTSDMSVCSTSKTGSEISKRCCQ